MVYTGYEMKGRKVMNINPTTLGFQANPTKITRLYIPAKDGSGTLRCEIGGRVDKKITNIKYDLLKKGEIIESKSFQNKRGFADERLAFIYEVIQQHIQEGFDFLDELWRAQLKRSYKQ